MKKTMFNYTKFILEKVSFDPNLFCKEVAKALDYLLPYEIERLTKWLIKYTKGKPELQQCTLLILK